MSIHIDAKKGEIAPAILLPGDPLRARFFAETLLEDAVCFNNVRGMLGFTGRHDGREVSVMGTGMGMPTLAIYLHELINEYDVKTLIRVGTCGALQPGLDIGELVLPMSASTNSNMNKRRFGGLDYAPTADFDLLPLHPGGPVPGRRALGADGQRQPGDRRGSIRATARKGFPADGRNRPGNIPLNHSLMSSFTRDN